MKKIKYASYYKTLNDSEIHSSIVTFIISSIIQDESQISHTWSLID